MPYIKIDARDKFEPQLSRMGVLIRNEGELNYVISSICAGYLRVWGKDYRMLNALIGVLECAKQELYREVVAPYEDGKIRENGRVY